jgi:hypothetical protein
VQGLAKLGFLDDGLEAGDLFPHQLGRFGVVDGRASSRAGNEDGAALLFGDPGEGFDVCLSTGWRRGLRDEVEGGDGGGESSGAEISPASG